MASWESGWRSINIGGVGKKMVLDMNKDIIGMCGGGDVGNRGWHWLVIFNLKCGLMR